jgi:uncharacterized protein with HEPN domain
VLRLSRHDPTVAAKIEDYPQIISFRNILIHGYDLVDVATVWQVIRADLPRLELQIEGLLLESG